MGSENGNFCLLTVHREWVGGSEKVQKPAYVMFECLLMNYLYIIYATLIYLTANSRLTKQS